MKFLCDREITYAIMQILKNDLNPTLILEFINNIPYAVANKKLSIVAANHLCNGRILICDDHFDLLTWHNFKELFKQPLKVIGLFNFDESTTQYCGLTMIIDFLQRSKHHPVDIGAKVVANTITSPKHA